MARQIVLAQCCTIAATFEAQYPTIHRFVEEIGWIEIGQHEVISSFVWAYDEGGTVYEGKASYHSMEAAFQDLEAGIKAYLDKWEFSTRSDPLTFGLQTQASSEDRIAIAPESVGF